MPGTLKGIQFAQEASNLTKLRKIAETDSK